MHFDFKKAENQFLISLQNNRCNFVLFMSNTCLSVLYNFLYNLFPEMCPTRFYKKNNFFANLLINMYWLNSLQFCIWGKISYMHKKLFLKNVVNEPLFLPNQRFMNQKFNEYIQSKMVELSIKHCIQFGDLLSASQQCKVCHTWVLSRKTSNSYKAMFSYSIVYQLYFIL